jgi:hypothetical protein
LHDAVAVLLATGERKQDVKPLRFEWHKPLWIGKSHADIYIVKKNFWGAVGLAFPLDHLAVADAFFEKMALVDGPVFAG